MSSRLEKIIVSLIHELHRIGVVNKNRIAEAIGIDEVFFVREMGRYNYVEIAEELKKHPVFMSVDRKRAVYARKKLEEILGTKVIKKRAKFGAAEGYLFILPQQLQEQR